MAGFPRILALALLVVSLLALFRPVLPWNRPSRWTRHLSRQGAQALPFEARWGAGASTHLLLTLVFALGLVGGEAASQRDGNDCRLTLPSTASATVEGRFMARVSPGRAAPFRAESGVPGDCFGTFRVVWPRDLPTPPTGVRLSAAMTWEGKGWPEPGRGEWAGRWIIDANEPPQLGSGGDLWGQMLRVRGRVTDQIARLWGRQAPVVEALILARKEHLSPELRDAFARSGTAHLLAISGFHVGVLAGILLLLGRMMGLSPRRAPLVAAVGGWIYVVGIGAPDAAVRAVILLTFIAAARLRGVPPMSVGLLSSAFFLILLWDPGALRSVGFQLSFAGTLGLATLRRPLEEGVDTLRRSWTGREPPPRGTAVEGPERWLRDGTDGLVAGTAATLPTLPLLAWHFDEISLIGIPMTLLVAPLVALAIPGILLALIVSMPSPQVATFLAGGSGVLLDLTSALVRFASGLPGAAIWVSRPTLAVVVCGVVGTGFMMTTLVSRGMRRWVRLVGPVSATVAALLLVPLWTPLRAALGLPRPLEVHMIDVGQGDATAIRFPDGAWILIDAGPSSLTWDAGARRVVPYLRRRGVRTLEALVLTHPHLDHVGGAGAVLEAFRVRGILDPSLPSTSQAHLGILRAGARNRVSWWRAEAGRMGQRGEVVLEVLHPVPREVSFSGTSDPNRDSVILLIRYGNAAVLITGDAYVDAEQRLAPELPPLTVLKAGHHGSRTSTSSALLEATRPALVLLSLGDGNRYGHPHREVLERLEAVNAAILRSDRDGSVRVRIRPGGDTRVWTDR